MLAGRRSRRNQSAEKSIGGRCTIKRPKSVNVLRLDERRALVHPQAVPLEVKCDNQRSKRWSADAEVKRE